jgi:hypothetical protein
VLVIGALSLRCFKREARLQRSLCHFELLGSRLARPQPMLQLVPGLGKSP